MDADSKNPARVVFRLCFRTSSEHLGQAGCFRLPVKACRPQPLLCVPESFNLRSEFSVARHEQGRVKSNSSLAKNATVLPQHPCQYRESNRGRLEKTRRELGGRKGVLVRVQSAALAIAVHPLIRFPVRATFAQLWSRQRSTTLSRAALVTANGTVSTMPSTFYSSTWA